MVEFMRWVFVTVSEIFTVKRLEKVQLFEE